MYALSAFMIIVLVGGFALWGLGEHEYSLGDCIYFALITAATGAIPRADDIGLRAALAVAQEPPPPLPELPRLPMPEAGQTQLELE